MPSSILMQWGNAPKSNGEMFFWCGEDGGFQGYYVVERREWGITLFLSPEEARPERLSGPLPSWPIPLAPFAPLP